MRNQPGLIAILSLVVAALAAFPVFAKKAPGVSPGGNSGSASAPPASPASLLPAVIGNLHRTEVHELPITDHLDLWRELGLSGAEEGTFEGSGHQARIRVWRLQDTTSALSAFSWKRSADARTASEYNPKLTTLAVESPQGVLLAVGNYLAEATGYRPTLDELADFFRRLPKLENSQQPPLLGYMPALGEVPNSGHYILGPAGLQQFLPTVSPATVAFSMGAEAQVTRYRRTGKDLLLGLFSYPTSEIARNRQPKFQEIPGTVVKRSGPILAVVLPPNDPNAAEKLLGEVRYQADVTVGQKPLTKRDNPANLMLNIFFLVGILIVFCAVSGLVVGGLRMSLRRAGESGEGNDMISLHLEHR